jgi:hypothetical protein
MPCLSSLECLKSKFFNSLPSPASHNPPIKAAAAAADLPPDDERVTRTAAEGAKPKYQQPKVLLAEVRTGDYMVGNYRKCSVRYRKSTLPKGGWDKVTTGSCRFGISSTRTL